MIRTSRHPSEYQQDLNTLGQMARGSALTLAMAHVGHLYKARTADSARGYFHYRNTADAVSRCFNVLILSGHVV